MLFEILSCVDTRGWRGPTVTWLALVLELVQAGNWLHVCSQANLGRDVAQACGDQAGRDFLDLACAVANFARGIPDQVQLREQAMKAILRTVSAMTLTKESNLHNVIVARLLLVWCCHKEQQINRWRIKGWVRISNEAAERAASIYLAQAHQLLYSASRRVYMLDPVRHAALKQLLDELEWEPGLDDQTVAEPALALESKRA